MTETIEIEQEITEKVLSHVSEAYGGFSTAEKAAEELVAKAKARLVEAAELANTHGFSRDALIERLDRDFEDRYIDESLFTEVYKRKLVKLARNATGETTNWLAAPIFNPNLLGLLANGRNER
jgi:hypothetical protein